MMMQMLMSPPVLLLLLLLLLLRHVWWNHALIVEMDSTSNKIGAPQDRVCCTTEEWLLLTWGLPLVLGRECWLSLCCWLDPTTSHA